MDNEAEIVKIGDHMVRLYRFGEYTFQRVLNPKCVSCRCFWEPNDDDMKSSGSYYKSCRRRRKPQKTAEQVRDMQRKY